ncbi:MAG: succinylglutamate desuccinylase/aspartoacylase family protein [Saprospiraceae bacterium]|nr:succinylglutamate desuccinylase/aspartoacylase family protein [Saprospiraceae bacterium]
MVISGTTIEPGCNEIIRLTVGRLPSDTRIYIRAHVFRSTEPGPTILAMAGVHGDEINGVEIVRRLIANGTLEHLKRGTVIAIPLLNIYGFINFSREVPDGKDVNRSFPGHSTGSLASRVANAITKKILPSVDFGVDFHTGGSNNYNYPQIRYSKGDAASKKLAETFSPPYLLANRPIPKSLRKAGLDLGKPILTYEGGENLRFDGFAIEKGLEGMMRILKSENMLEADIPPCTSITFEKTTWIRASRAGLFRWSKRSGNRICKGECLGVINDPYGLEEIPVLARHDGYIIGHNNAPVVSTGDALFHVGFA